MNTEPSEGEPTVGLPSTGEAGSSPSPHGQSRLSTHIRSLQIEQRRRRRVRTAAIWTVPALAAVALVALFAVFWSAPPTPEPATSEVPAENEEATSIEVPRTAKDSTEGPAGGTSIPTTSNAGPDAAARAPSTSVAPTTSVPRIECDSAAISAALLQAPEPQDIDGSPQCSKTFWAVPVVGRSDPERLTVVFERSGDTLEPIAVVARSECTAVALDEPAFDPTLCPS